MWEEKQVARRLPWLSPLSLLTWLWAGAAPAAEVVSPDGNLAAIVEVVTLDGVDGCLAYSVSFKGRPIVVRSGLGLEFADSPWTTGLEIVEEAASERDETWRPVYGERSGVRDHYRQLALLFRQRTPPRRSLRVTFRAYNEGVAFSYGLPQQGSLESVQILRERSEFRFAKDHPAWVAYRAQAKYEKLPLSSIKPGCERPLVIQVDDDLYAALAEARLVDYARMKLAPLESHSPALVSHLEGPVSARLPMTTPWRVVMVAESPGRLLENNDLILNLNDPSAIDDTSWIKPGKVIREVTLTTAGGKACVEFAARRNLQYVEFDAGWYGHEYSDDSDATTVTVDPKRSPGPLDLEELIRHAQSRGIGVILYVNRRALERQLDEILPLYQKWGVAGVKYGFVQVGSQEATTWLHEAVRKAAGHRLMVDVHDEYRPTGYSRTYPNLMTQEGIAGDETRPANDLTLTILFTRMLSGAADNTICYYDSRVDENASHAYQLAKAVCFYSPWQFLYWYDRPAVSPAVGGAGGEQRLIGEEPELEFFDHVPTVWDDIRVIHGRIGQYAVIARRSGAEWYVGCMNDATPRTLAVPLDFLTPGRPYTAHVYYDDPAAPTRTHVAINRTPVDSRTVLSVDLPARGGQAIRIVPAGFAPNEIDGHPIQETPNR